MKNKFMHATHNFLPPAMNKAPIHGHMKTILLFCTLALPLVVVSCDSAQEDAREKALENRADALENRADAVKKEGEHQADAIEDAKKLNDLNAEATRKEAEAKAEALKKEAEATREQK